MADALTSYYANYGDWRKLFTSIDDIDKVTADDVQRVAKQVSDAGNAHGGLHRPAARRAKPARGERSGQMKTLLLLSILCAGLLSAQTEVRRAIVLPSYKDLKFPPLPPLKVPEPTEITLSNGMKVLLLEDHELPLISGAALIRTGNLFDPPDKKGLAGITGEVLRSGGTKARTGDQIDQDLENVAASIESQIGETNGTLSFSCLKENTDQVLALFRDLLTSPEFRQDKVDLAKTQSRSEISRRNDDADGIAEREFSDIVYGRNTPYGWSIEYADIDNIQRQDLIDFYHRYYFPANITLEVIGDFSTAEMKTKLEQLFGAWKYTQPAVPAFPKVEDKARARCISGIEGRHHPDLLPRRRISAASCATKTIRRWKWPLRFWAADFPAGCFRACAPSTAGLTTSRANWGAQLRSSRNVCTSRAARNRRTPSTR